MWLPLDTALNILCRSECLSENHFNCSHIQWQEKSSVLCVLKYHCRFEKLTLFISVFCLERYLITPIMHEVPPPPPKIIYQQGRNQNNPLIRFRVNNNEKVSQTDDNIICIVYRYQRRKINFMKHEYSTRLAYRKLVYSYSLHL